MKAIFGEGGCLADILNFYEYREAQLHMAEFLSKVLLDNENALVEAGTGTGKSMAYLVPALKHALEEGKICAVSTETKALQKQLIDKDIPILKKIFKKEYGQEFKYSLCLGSSNYPCRRRFESAVQRGGSLFEKKMEMDTISEAFDSGTIFSRFDVMVSESSWEEVRRDPDICSPYKCIYAKDCVFQRVKREWATSNLLIMNHYLFFSNIAVGKTYLPKFDIVVFDEAHSLDEIGASQLGFDISNDLLLDIMKYFYIGKRRNVITSIPDEEKRKRAVNLISEITSESSRFFVELLKKLSHGRSRTLRLRGALDFGEELARKIESFLKLLKENEEHFEEESVKMEFEAGRGKLFAFMQALNMAVYGFEDNWVSWLELSYDEKVHLVGKPLEINEVMRNDVFSFYDSSIFVSATLAINKDFGFLMEKLGLDREECETLILDSPFDFKKSVMLYVPKEICDPSDIRYSSEGALYCRDIIEELDGSCLILFTSYEMLKSFHQELYPLVKRRIFAQGELSAVDALRGYLDNPGSVLMGTHSYWQGLDLPGDTLKGVIVARLPFLVPDRPDVEAMIESYEKRGLKPFYCYQIPKAVIKFKQGFGRLIRSKKDRGVVAVLDSRIITKSYGKMFLNSLPECAKSTSFEKVREFIEGIRVS